ncbi:protein sprouty homolog 2, partial [Thrips palmi]|uniref:Protein sprouty homolog 2 n=1 Tax=Thrips palmi TaxID=161013 RepID=A0A6P8Z8Z4_THRPL
VQHAVHAEVTEVSLAAPRPDGERRANEYVETPLQHQQGSRSSKEAKESAALGSSILCAECGRCRCAACQEPRPLPSRWLCEDTCFCSAETTLDYATCLCCVKGLFYHCGDEAGVWCADDPCSCAGAAASSGAGSRRCARWSCLALASVVLPCLLCYWPLRGVVRATELCYARYCDDGCRCERRPSSGAARTHPARTHPANATALLTTPEKRLLDTD